MQSFAKELGYEGEPFVWDEERRFVLQCELNAIIFYLYLGDQESWSQNASKHLLKVLPTPEEAIKVIMDNFPIVQKKEEKKYESYLSKDKILKYFSVFVEYLSKTDNLDNTLFNIDQTLDPSPGPPCDKDGNFIPVNQWDPDNWPSHIHRPIKNE